MDKFSAEPAHRDRGVMLKPLKKRILFFLSFFALSVFFTTCGLEEAYFLPQVPEVYIRTEFNTSAAITLPRLDSIEFYYAQSYKIFYRIYISDFNATTDDISDYSKINSTLYTDFYNILPNTDSTSTSSGTAANILFTNRNYYELFIENNNRGVNIETLLTTSGGDISISFPPVLGSYPILTINNTEYRLLRSDAFFTPNTNLDNIRYFRNISDINDSKNANTDVVQRTDLTQTQTAYVSMYIVAFGSNPINFTNIYSKPTHICVFKLPDN